MARSREEERAYRREYRARRKAAAAAATPADGIAGVTPVPPRPKKSVHRAAVTRMLKATGLAHIPEEAPLVELVKSLAAQLDAGGDSAIAARYRTALVDVRKVLAYSGRPKSSAEPAAPAPSAESASPSPAGEPVARVNSLAAFKRSRGIE